MRRIEVKGWPKTTIIRGEITALEGEMFENFYKFPYSDVDIILCQKLEESIICYGCPPITSSTMALAQVVIPIYLMLLFNNLFPKSKQKKVCQHFYNGQRVLFTKQAR